MVLIYQVENKVYYQVLNWWSYQHPQWVGPSDHPAPDGWLDRMRYHGEGHRVITENWPESVRKPKADKPPDKSPDKLPLAEEEVKEEVEVKEEENTGASAQPPDFLRLQFEMSVPVIQDRQLTRSQWEDCLLYTSPSPRDRS